MICEISLRPGKSIEFGQNEVLKKYGSPNRKGYHKVTKQNHLLFYWLVISVSIEIVTDSKFIEHVRATDIRIQQYQLLNVRGKHFLYDKWWT